MVNLMEMEETASHVSKNPTFLYVKHPQQIDAGDAGSLAATVSRNYGVWRIRDSESGL